mmetsp:Transcript_76488/g.211708  ORF Transcript_76488/g.211708 Transcript_76488/m.211708 type:complete len:99 (+) Transcript_76488:106-402(+)
MRRRQTLRATVAATLERCRSQRLGNGPARAYRNGRAEQRRMLCWRCCYGKRGSAAIPAAQSFLALAMKTPASTATRARKQTHHQFALHQLSGGVLTVL